MKTKSRGNGQGTAYRRGNVWVAQAIVGWRVPDDAEKKPIPVKKTKSGFATKKEAIRYLPELFRPDSDEIIPITLEAMYEEWEKSYGSRVLPKTLKGYAQAFAHFSSLHVYNVNSITAAELQQCMDACKEGKRTHQMMKTTANLLWKYAIDARYAAKNVAVNLYIGKGASVQRKPFSASDMDAVRMAIGRIPYADYVYALCYLGFRPTEFLSLKKTDYHKEGEIEYLVGGSKTDAGKDRRVVIPSQISGIIQDRLAVDGTDLLFPMVCHNRKGEFTGYKQMTHNYFNNFCYKPLAEKLGIVGKVPYSARHTYADKLKKADGDGKDKAALIGHTDYDFTQHRYQSTSLEDLDEIVKSIE